MRFDDPSFTDRDSKRADAVAPTSHILASAAWEGIRALQAFRQFYIGPVLQGLIGKSDREQAVLGIHYRMAAYLASLRRLDGPIHVQSIAASARSIFELGLDMLIFHRDATSESCDRLSAFTRVERYRVARKIVDFYSSHTVPSDIDISAQQALCSDPVKRAEVEALILKHWGRAKKGKLNWPAHWSRFQNARARAEASGPGWEHYYVRHWYMLSWHVHSGMAGVAGLDKDAFDVFAAEAYQLSSEILMESFRILGKELRLDEAMPEWHQRLAFLEKVRVRAVLDNCLMSLGEPRRFNYLEQHEEGSL